MFDCQYIVDMKISHFRLPQKCWVVSAQPPIWSQTVECQSNKLNHILECHPRVVQVCFRLAVISNRNTNEQLQYMSNYKTIDCYTS